MAVNVKGVNILTAYPVMEIVGMPIKGGRFTPQERAFIDAQVAVGDPRVAAAKAGYAKPGIAGYAIAARPAIAAEVVKLQTQRLVDEILPLAVDQHKALLASASTPAGAKAQLIKLAYDRTMGSQDAKGRKELHEMTVDELADELEQLKRRQADMAKVVDVQVLEDPPAGDVFA